MNTPKTVVQLRTYTLIAERKLTEVESGTHLFRTVAALVKAGLVAYSRTTGTPGFRRRDGREIPGVTVLHDLHVTTREGVGPPGRDGTNPPERDNPPRRDTP